MRRWEKKQHFGNGCLFIPPTQLLAPSSWELFLFKIWNSKFLLKCDTDNGNRITFSIFTLFLPFFLPHYRWKHDMLITMGAYLQIGEKKIAQPRRQQDNTHYMRAFHFLWLALVAAEIVGGVGSSSREPHRIHTMLSAASLHLTLRSWGIEALLFFSFPCDFELSSVA